MTNLSVSLLVRVAGEYDLPGIQHVARRTWWATYAGMIPDEVIERIHSTSCLP